MSMTWTPKASSPQIIQTLDQIVDLPIAQLESCQQAIKDATDLVQSALDLHELIQLFKGEPPRFRHDRVAENVAYITRKLSSFADWNGGSLLRLCVLSKQDVTRVVCEARFREALRSRIPAVEVHDGHIAKIERLKSNTAVLIQRVKCDKKRKDRTVSGDEIVNAKRLRVGDEEQPEIRYGQFLRNESPAYPMQNAPESTQLIQPVAFSSDKSPPGFAGSGTGYSGTTDQVLINEETRGVVDFVYSDYWDGSASYNQVLPTT
ncbi:hypothetical protein PMIN04_010325 [Paraphaeosphaeria minitans]